MTNTKGFILNHQVDGLCFIEAPEKPSYYQQFVHSLNHDGLRGFSNIQINEMKEYQKALELAIANRMVIVNIDAVVYTNVDRYCWKHDHNFIEVGEIYLWPGTVGKKREFRQYGGSTWYPFNGLETHSDGFEHRTVVRLIAPTEQKAVSLPSANEDQEEQTLAWRDIYMNFNDGEGWTAFANRMRNHFTITRK